MIIKQYESVLDNKTFDQKYHATPLEKNPRWRKSEVGALTPSNFWLIDA